MMASSITENTQPLSQSPLSQGSLAKNPLIGESQYSIAHPGGCDESSVGKDESPEGVEKGLQNKGSQADSQTDSEKGDESPYYSELVYEFDDAASLTSVTALPDTSEGYEPTSIDVVSLGNDRFIINGQGMSLAELIMMIEIQRANLLETQLADELDQMQELNELLEEANEMLALARVEEGKLEGDETSDMPPEMVAFFEEHDIEQGVSSDEDDNYIQDKDQWEVSIENLKAFIDSLNSRSQLDMLNISSLMKKRDESLTLPANTNSTIHQTNMSIISKYN